MDTLSMDKNENWRLLVAFGVLVGIHLLTLNRNYMIYLSTDEFSQWAIAAHLNGVDWSKTMQVANIQYYSYFYALFLTPIFKFITDIVWMYRVALIFNAIMSAGIVFFSYVICKNYIKSKELSLVLAFCAASYSGTILQSNFTWAETFLIMQFWFVLYVLMKMLKSNISYVQCGLFAFLLSFGYMAHQRWVGVLISGCLTMLILRGLKKINGYQLLCFSIIVFSMIMLHESIKSYFLTNVWVADASAQGALRNDYVGQIEKIRYVLSLEGFRNILNIMAGQLFYLGTSTFLLAYWGLYYLFKEVIFGIKVIASSHLKEKENISKKVFCFFSLSSIILTFLIGVVFLSMPKRLDHIVYGRYNEMVIGILLIFGFIEVQKNGFLKKSMILFTFYGGLALITFKYINECVSKGLVVHEFQTVCAVGIGIFELFQISHTTMVLMIILVSIIIYVLFKSQRLFFKKIGGGILSGIFIVIGTVTVLKTSIPAGEIWYPLIEITEYAKQRNNSSIYWCGRSNIVQMPFTQYLLRDIPLKIMNVNGISQNEFALDMEDIANCNIEEGAFVFSIENPLLFDGYKMISSRMGIVLLEKTGDEGIFLPIKEIPTQIGTINSEGILESHGEAGALMYGPYWKLDPGRYEFCVELELVKSEDEDVGIVDLLTVQNGKEIKTETKLKKTDFENGMVQKITMEVDLLEGADSFEFRVFVNEGVDLRISSLYADMK